MGTAMSGGVHKRDGANRAFGYAVLASILLHALLLLALPALRELAASLPPARSPLAARLVQAQSEHEPAAATEESRKPPVAQKRPVAPRVVAEQAPAPVAAPVAQPAAAVVSEPLAPAPAAPTTPAAPGPVARVEPRPAAESGIDPLAVERYRIAMIGAASSFKRYPRVAIDNNWTGETVVRMTIGADGKIAALGIKSSSGYEALDRQALEMFRITKPFVLLPPQLAGREFEVAMPVRYGLDD